MMTHPAGAGGAAHRAGPSVNGTTAEAGRGLGIEFDGPGTPTPAGAEAAPFSQALQAIAAGVEATRTGVAASGAAVIEPADADADESQGTHSAPGTQIASAPNGGVMPGGAWRSSSALAGSPTGASEPVAAEPAMVNSTVPTASACASPGAGAGATAVADAKTGVGTTGDAGSTPRGPRTPSARQSVARGEARGGARNTARAAAAPKPGAAALPNDLLQALFAAQSALPAQGNAAPVAPVATGDEHDDNTGHDDGRSDADSAAAAAPMPVPVAIPTPPQSTDAGAAMLAAVLQWTQSPRGDSNERNVAATAPGAVEPCAADSTAAVGSNPDAPASSAPLWSTATATVGSAAGGTSAAQAMADAPARPATVRAVASPPTVQPQPSQALASRSDLVASTGDLDSVASVSDSPGKPLATRDGASSGSMSDAVPLPRSAADVAVGALGMAAALRVTGSNGVVPTERTVAVSVHDRHWPAAVATQVLILSNDKVQAATLRLSPEHLGPVEVRIDMQDANVNVNFTAVHADTRAALEQALPELRTVLAGAGLTLGQATVQQQTRHESQIPNAPPRNGVVAAETAIEAPAAQLRSLGIIDEYA